MRKHILKLHLKAIIIIRFSNKIKKIKFEIIKVKSIILKLKNLLIKCTKKNKLFHVCENSICFGIYADLVVCRGKSTNSIR